MHHAAVAALVGGSLLFFSDTLAIIGHDGITLRLADGTQARGDAAYVDLRTDRALLAGHARITHGAQSIVADAVAVELDTTRIDLLDAQSGAATTTRLLGAPAPTPIDAARFAFPEVNEKGAFIKAQRATIVPHADARFSPASFPTSAGSVPVPSYLYTYATAAGFGATSLNGAAFDQPYGLFGTPNALTALHARWIDGSGAALALQQQLVSGDDAYLAVSVDAPLRGAGARGLNAYRRVGSRMTLTANGSSGAYGWGASTKLTAALGRASGALAYGMSSGGFSTLDASVRSPDVPLVGGATFSLRGDFGEDSLRGGLLTQLPDRARWTTVWRHALDASIATPVVQAPLGVRIGTTFDARRTWYAFPHHGDAIGGSANLSRKFSNTVTLLGDYAATWTHDVYPNAQALFYAAPVTPLVTPDGTVWPGYAAYTGAQTSRAATLGVQVTPDPSTSWRLSLTHSSDFPQYHGFGRPVWELRGDARVRPFPNIGLSVGRVYDFAWGGTRWVPRWSFAITP